MKFVRFDGGRTGLVIEAEGKAGWQVLDISASLDALHKQDRQAAERIDRVLPAAPGQSWVPMIGQWDDVRHDFGALETLPPERLALRDLDDVSLEPPLASPSVHIFALGSNTTDHIVRAFKIMQNLDLTHAQARRGKDEGLPPFGFTLWPATVAAPGATVAPPKGTLKFDYEAECAVYVKHGGRNLQSVDLWGYTAFNDLGVRDPFLKLVPDSPWGPFSLNLPKNFDTSNACGPWVVVDEGHDVTALRCRMLVNGQTRQDWNLREMIYSFDEALAHISTSMTLRPGDMLSSGTGAGVALESGADGPHWLRPGDVMEVLLDGLAPLRNFVGDW